MELRQIQYFVCLYEERSVTRAAQRLNIVQSALSMQISRLESELAKKLFIRRPQGMEPTPDAQRIYRLFMPVLQDFAHAREQALQTDMELSGQVRIGMIATITQGALVETVRMFSEAHPRVALSLTDGYSGALIDAVTQGHLDAAIINKPRRALALATLPIAEEELWLVTGARHAPLPAEVEFRSLEKLKLILPTRRHGMRDVIESFAQVENVDLAPALEIDAISAILKLVESSDFATLMPRIAAGLNPGRIHRVVSPTLRRQVVCVTHPRRPLSQAAAVFVKSLAQHIQAITIAVPAAPQRARARKRAV